MKIQSIELFKVPPRWLFLKLTTGSGVVGWGEPVVEGRADTVAACVNEMLDVFAYKNGHVDLPRKPGLGIEIDEDYVRQIAADGHDWHNPVWRDADGAVAEW